MNDVSSRKKDIPRPVEIPDQKRKGNKERLKDCKDSEIHKFVQCSRKNVDTPEDGHRTEMWGGTRKN
jgi:hypothetical protein